MTARNQPTQIGRFKILGTLGVGAAATVYRAHDPRLARDVALKVAQLTTERDPRRLERFLREARRTAQLRHPHIVPVYDAGAVENAHYLAAALVDGRDLADRLAEGEPLTLQPKVRIVRQIALALAYSHRKGIVHRDVKPANVLLDAKGQAYLADFGIAVQLEAEERLTHAGELLGTPAYMAPEQIANPGSQPTPLGDQYSLGVIFYELLCGQPPFNGTAPQVLHQALNESPRAPRSVSRSIPLDLERICLKAMARDAGRRYVDCQALADDLRRWQEGEPVRARPPGVVERGLRWLKREPVLGATVGLTLVALLTLLVVPLVTAAWLTTAISAQKRAHAEAEQQAAQADAAARLLQEQTQQAALALESSQNKRRTLTRDTAEADQSVAAARAAEQKAKQSLAELTQRRAEAAQIPYCVDILRASVRIQQRHFAEALPILRQHEPKAEAEDQRGFEWWYLAGLAPPREVEVTPAIDQVELARASTDGVTLLTKEHGLYRIGWADLEAGKRPSHLDLAAEVKGQGIVAGRKWDLPRFGAWVCVAQRTSEGIRVRRSDKAELHWNRPQPEPGVQAFSADGKHLATHSPVAGQPEPLLLWDLDKGTSAPHPAIKSNRLTQLQLSPAGDVIALVTQQNRQGVELWTRQGNEARHQLGYYPGAVQTLGFSPDGKLIVATGSERLVAWNATTGERQFEARAAGQPLISPDGRYVVLPGMDGGTRVDVLDVAQKGQRILSLDYSVKSPSCVTFAPEQGLVSFVAAQVDGDAVIVCDLIGRGVTARPLHRSDTVALATAPKGERLLIVAKYGVAALPLSTTRPTRLGEPGLKVVSLAVTASDCVSINAGGRLVRHSPGKTPTSVSLAVGTVALRPDGQQLASATRNGVVLSDATGQEVRRLAEGKDVQTLAWSSDGKRLALATDRVFVLDLDANAEREVKSDSPPSCLALTRDGQTLIEGDKQSVKVRDVGSGKVRWSVQLAEEVRALACSPNDRTLAVVGTEGSVRLYHLTTSQELLKLSAEVGPLTTVAFDGRGETLAVGSANGLIRLWRAPK